jgi:hypothetical protein
MVDRTEEKPNSLAEPPAVAGARILWRSRALFKAMHSDFLLREQFVTDPVQVVSEYVYDKKLAPLNASVANQLVYSVVSSRSLFKWLVHYSREGSHRSTAHGGFAGQFGRAVADSGDYRVVLSLIRSSLVKESPSGFETFGLFVQALSAVLGDRNDRFGTGIASADTGGDTGSSTGGDTGSSTGGDTGTSADTGRGIYGADVGGDAFGFIDPYNLAIYARDSLAVLIQYATELLNLGALDVIEH